MNRFRLQSHKSRIAAAATVVLLTALLTTFHSPRPGDLAPRILVSVDRSLWNRLGFNRMTYRRALRDAGLHPVIVDFTTLTTTGRSARSLLEGMHGLVISGGGDVDPAIYGGDARIGRDVNRARDEFELALLGAAERQGLPVLGICRGAQLINVYRGGTLGDFRADSPRHRRHRRVGSGHPVNLEPGSRLRAIFGVPRLDSVVTFHGQYVDSTGNDVRISARAPDGTPEAIEVAGGPGFGMLGVQWHAEVVPWDTYQARLFGAFAEAADAARTAEPRIGR